MFQRLFKRKTNAEEGASFLIAGLGNPEKKYDGTRHNVGFAVIDALSEAHGFPKGKTKNRALVAVGMIGGQKVLLVKPLTYMNASGEAIRALCDYYRIDSKKKLIVISDEIHLEIGTIRIREKGSAGGHNGLKDIIKHLGHEEFTRIRVGVGNAASGEDMIAHVLSKVAKEDRERMRESIERASNAAAMVVTDGAERAMNLYNTKKT